MPLMTPSTVKETVVSWRHVKVITAQLPDPNLLHSYSVFVADEAGVPVSLAAHYATEAAADHEHQKIVRQLATGTIVEGDLEQMSRAAQQKNGTARNRTGNLLLLKKSGRARGLIETRPDP